MQTDAGPDEAGTRLRALDETLRVVTTWVVGSEWYSHVYDPNCQGRLAGARQVLRQDVQVQVFCDDFENHARMA